MVHSSAYAVHVRSKREAKLMKNLIKVLEVYDTSSLYFDKIPDTEQIAPVCFFSPLKNTQKLNLTDIYRNKNKIEMAYKKVNGRDHRTKNVGSPSQKPLF